MPRWRLRNVASNTFQIDAPKRIFRSKTNRRAAICPALLFLRAPFDVPGPQQKPVPGFLLKLGHRAAFPPDKAERTRCPTGVLPRDSWRIGFQTYEKP